MRLARRLARFASSLRRFAGEGESTLAPWDPPRRLVVTGPYRFVRNPMISGVIFLLLGEASVLVTHASRGGAAMPRPLCLREHERQRAAVRQSLEPYITSIAAARYANGAFQLIATSFAAYAHCASTYESAGSFDV
jgi:protein-S-isoprenylcysteine O-methyltransferase Ste14